MKDDVKNVPTLLLGIGSFKKLQTEINFLNAQNTIIIADSSMKENNSLRLIKATIAKSTNNVKVHFIENVKRKLTCTYDFPMTLLIEEYDTIVGVGNNDLLNYSKLVAMFARQFDEGTSPSTRTLLKQDKNKKLFLLPSSVTFGIEATNKTYTYKDRMKVVKNNDGLAATTIIYDPLVAIQSPLHERVMSTVITFAHAFETYFFMRKFNKFPIASLKLLFKYVIRATYNKRDIEAQEALLKSGMLLGLADLYNLSLPLIHCFIIPIMRKVHCSYEVAVALMLPYIMRMYQDVNKERSSILMEALDLPYIDKRNIDGYLTFQLVNIFKAIGFELRLESIGITRNDIAGLGREAFLLWLQNNLTQPSWQELHFISVYKKAFEAKLDYPFH